MTSFGLLVFILVCGAVFVDGGEESVHRVAQRAVRYLRPGRRAVAAAAERFASQARENGFGAIIAAAGKAAHLAGVLAAYTTLPVIGIPMKGGAMDGLDALLATVQMPSGIPVATVALNGAKNAAVLAAQMLAIHDARIAALLAEDREKMARSIAEKDAAIRAEAAAL